MTTLMSLITNMIITIITFNVNTWALILDFWDMDPLTLEYLGYQDPYLTPLYVNMLNDNTHESIKNHQSNYDHHYIECKYLGFYIGCLGHGSIQIGIFGISGPPM